jgi:hypothetical protein
MPEVEEAIPPPSAGVSPSMAEEAVSRMRSTELARLVLEADSGHAILTAR